MNKSRSLMRWALLVLILAGAAAAWAALRPAPAADALYLTEPVTRGDLVETVSASGTLNPVVLVSIGTQVSGTAVNVHADFNDKVVQNQVLVELDPASYEARVRQTRAAMEAAQASEELAKANEARAQDLYDKGYVARQDLDQARQALKSASAQVEQSRAQMEDALVDLRNSVIRSPVSGVVVARTVEIGQTVAASFQTPELFKIAGDLRQMLIHTTFAEADIGRIRPGQDVRFTVDAFPDRGFRGAVRQVRLNPTTTQNVVTYDVVVDVNNEDLVLLPGMTAYVNVILSKTQDSLRVPNAALRYRPGEDVVVRTLQGPSAATPGTAVPAPVRSGAESRRSGAGGRRGAAREPTVHAVRGAELVAIPVRIGATDGRYTTITSDQIREGELLIVGDRVAQTDAAQPNPATMRMRMF